MIDDISQFDWEAFDAVFNAEAPARLIAEERRQEAEAREKRDREYRERQEMWAEHRRQAELEAEERAAEQAAERAALKAEMDLFWSMFINVNELIRSRGWTLEMVKRYCPPEQYETAPNGKEYLVVPLAAVKFIESQLS